MSEAFRYDVVRYPSRAYAHAHPDRLYVLGKLFGMTPAPPQTARILELGCGEGGHLLPMAVRMPGCEVVGVDLAETAVAAGQAAIDALGLTNARMIHADVSALPDDLGTFDYILCHGVFSWIPESARTALLAATRTHLRPQGIAYISYNTYPGWHTLNVARDIMRTHAAGFDDPLEQARQGKAMVRFLAEQTGEHPSPYARVLRQQAEMTERYSDAYFYHDYLSPDNEPMLFTEFIRRAASEQLAYLGDADLGLMMPTGVPPALKETLDRISPDLIALEQYMDFVRGTSFRRSLLIHKDVDVRRALQAEDLSDLAVVFTGTPKEGMVDLSNEEPVVFEAHPDITVTVRDRLGKAALLRLVQANPLSLTFDDLLQRAIEWVGEASPNAREELATILLYVYRAGLVDLAPRDRGAVAGVSERPLTDAWVRAQAATDETHMTNLRHEMVSVTRMDRTILTLLDGTRTIADIEAELMLAAHDGRMTVKVEGVPTSDDEIIREAIATALPDRMERFVRTALLSG